MKADRYIVIALATHRLARNKEHPMIVDIQYALMQLRGIDWKGCWNTALNDRVQRAIDALVRVEAELKTQPEPRTDTGHPTGL